MTEHAHYQSFVDLVIGDYKAHAMDFLGGDTSTALFLMHDRMTDREGFDETPRMLAGAIVHQAVLSGKGTTFDLVVEFAHIFFYTYLSEDTHMSIIVNDENGDGKQTWSGKPKEMLDLYTSLRMQDRIVGLDVITASNGERYDHQVANSQVSLVRRNPTKTG